MTPHTPVDPRCAWVGETIDRLKARSTPDQQFDILSRVALVRPAEEVAVYKQILKIDNALAKVDLKDKTMDRGQYHVLQSHWPRVSSTLQRLAISTLFASASGRRVFAAPSTTRGSPASENSTTPPMRTSMPSSTLI